MRKKEIIELIGEDRWDEFKKYMIGQTVSKYKDFETNYYATDVDRFISGSKVWD